MPMAADRSAARWPALCVSTSGSELIAVQMIDASELLEKADRLLADRKIQEAHQAFNQAQAAGAEADQCSSGRWFAAMLDGNFEAAWRESDAIRARGAADPHRFWNGEPLRDARVIVRCLHGLGDAVQMLRYAPRLRQIASSVIFEVPPQLLPLAPLFRGVDRVISWGALAPSRPPAWDVQIEIMELPYIFRTTVAELPMATSYLKLPQTLIKNVADAMGPPTRPRIGLVWAGGEWNRERSIPLSFVDARLHRSVELWSIQGSSAAVDAQPLVESGTIRDAIATCGDGLLALAATIENLDLVITVDTLAAHLAGALGKTVWVMLQHAADWRWMIDRNDSPWYPTMRLFRQAVPGDWSGVIDAVKNALDEWLSPPILMPAGTRK